MSSYRTALITSFNKMNKVVSIKRIKAPKKKLEIIIPARVKFAFRVKFFFIFNIFFISHFTALGILFQCHISFCTHIHCINVVLVMWSYCKTFHKSTTPFGRTVIKKALLLQGQKPCCTKITTEDKWKWQFTIIKTCHLFNYGFSFQIHLLLRLYCQ